MATSSLILRKTWPIWATVAATLALWLGCKWIAQDWFDNGFKYLAKTASLSATVLMCWTIVLSTRCRFIENLFGGLDKVYQVHRRTGRLAFAIILFHPLFLVLNRFPDIQAMLSGLWFQPPEGSAYLWGQNAGVIALLAMIMLIAVTLWFKLRYHIWKRSHEWFGAVLLLVIAHILLVDADIAAYPPLRIWMYAFLAAAAVAYVYIRFCYRAAGPRFSYRIGEIERVGEILEITLHPIGTGMDYKPSQFVYMVVRKPGFPGEPHPYSIACGYRPDGRLKLGVKKAGDYTRLLDRLAPGDEVVLYGPYGRFSERFLAADRNCVFIGAGIGITPFIGMWHVALHSEDRVAPEDVPVPLQRIHPELMRKWKSPLVSLFYVSRTMQDASFDDDIRREIELSHFHGFQAFERRGHHYEIYLTSRQGRFSAKYTAQHVNGGVQDKYIFLCGPTRMVNSLIKEFLALGVKTEQFVVEDFNLV